MAYGIKLDKSIDEIELDIAIKFGDKEYDTKYTEQLNEIKALSFSFQIFTKKLEQNESVIKPGIIKAEENKLDVYFKNEKYTTSTAKSTKDNEQEEEVNGKYLVTNYKLTDSSTALKISIKKSSKDSSISEDKLPKNLVLFANYSYEGIKTQEVLYTPNLTLLQVNINQVQK